MLSPRIETLLQALARDRQISVEELLETLLAENSPTGPARFFDLALVPMCVSNAEGYIIRINAPFEQLLGYTIEEWAQRPFIEFIHPDDQSSTATALTELSGGIPKFNFVNRYRAKNGDYLWLSWVSTPQPDGLIYAVVRDVTHERLLELQLKERTHELDRHVRQLEAVLDSQIDLISLHALDTTVLFVNDAYCNYFGKTREQLVGQSFLQFVAPEQHDAIWQRIEDIKQTVTPGVMITDNIARDGLRRTIQWSDHPITDESGHVIMIQSMGRDITRLMEVETQLASKERQYRLMFENNPMPMCVFNPATMGFLAVNEAMVRKYEYTHAEFSQMTLKDIRPREDVAQLEEYFQAYPDGELGSHTDDQWRHMTKSGHVFDVEINSHDIVFDGVPARLVMVIDITERRMLERQRLQQQLMQLEFDKERELNDQRDRFFTMVSHEFKTPLSVILSAANMIRDYYHRLSQQQITERLSIITDQAREALILIDDLLLIGRGQAGDVTPQVEPVDLVALCQLVIDNARIADNDHHTIIFDAPPPIILNADSKMIRQIIDNLVTNALKYSDAGSTVTVQLAVQSNTVTLSVQDEGIGIPKQDISRIFQAFVRASNATERKGTGLGLAIVRQNVEAHGGRIHVRSDEGKGTTISIRLPRRLTS